MPPNAKACPECGACEETGWNERAESDHLGLPNDEFDYDDFVKRELGEETAKPRGIAWFWWVAAAIVAAVFAVLLFR